MRARYDVSSLRLVIHAAAPCPVEVKQQMIDWLGPIVWEYYAGSENVGSTMIGPEEWLAHPGSVGQPRVHHRAHLRRRPQRAARRRGRPHLVRHAGRAPSSTTAIRRRRSRAAARRAGSTSATSATSTPRATSTSPTASSFTIISGGVNIYPQEAEDVLVMHPAVADVAVFGVPNEDLGEEVKAVVQLLDPSGPVRTWRRSCSRSAASGSPAFKCPRSIDFDHELPRQDTGKLYKRLLKDRYWGDRTSRIV